MFTYKKTYIRNIITC